MSVEVRVACPIHPNWVTHTCLSQHGNQLYHALFHIAPHIPQGAPPPTRVFQILHNTTDRPTLFSWPAEGYIPAEYGRLFNDVQIGGAICSDAKTSCTRRYKAQQVVDSADGSVRDVESIFIPHGQIIFACHKATPRRPRGHPNSYPLYPTPAQFYEPPAHPPYYPQVPVPSQADPYPGTSGAHAYSHYPHPHPSPGPSSPAPSRDAGTQSPYHHHQQTQTDWPMPPPPSYMDHGTQPLLDEVPPPRQRTGRLSPQMSAASLGPSHGSGTSTRESYSGGGRAGGNPPVGVSRCAACKSTSSPEWRKGPSGRKDLCNACGLRYSRARAKKEGIVVQRRRKDTGKTPAPQGQPPAHAQALPSRRRGNTGNGYTEFSLDEQHQHLGAGSGEGSTPSPSPPLDFSQPQHPTSSSGLYSYTPPQAMYSNPYSAGHHGNGFLASTASPVGTPLDTAPAITSASSYERAGMHPPRHVHS